jgi:multiple sugar transport system permease protein
MATTIPQRAAGFKPEPDVRRSTERPRARRDLGVILLYFLLSLGLSVTLMPFLWMILSSLKTATEMARIPPTFFPEEPTLANYARVIQDPRLPLLRLYGNSIFVAVSNVLTNLFTSSLLGYLFAKFEFRGKRALFSFFLLTMMIPGQVTMIPGYLILVKLHLLDTLWGLVLTSFVNAFGIFMLRQFVETLPNELLDAARIDGASEWQIYARVVVPQLGPALATLGTLTFMGNWNSYLWPMVVITTLEKRTLPVILSWYSDQHGRRPHVEMAATVMLVIPILIVYFFFQRWIVQGMTMTGLK